MLGWDMAKARKHIKFHLPFWLIAGLLLVLAILLMLATSKKQSSVDYICGNPDLVDAYDPEAKIGYFEGKEVSVPSLALKEEVNPVLGTSAGEKWIEIDLSEQKLRAWEGDHLFLETPVSTGLPWTPTPKGEFRIWVKIRATRMEGGSGAYYYNLPNVPYVMFFGNDKVPDSKGYSLHGTYWHNDFGRVHSHGCVNLPTPIAEKLYYWTTPTLPEKKNYIRADNSNLGTKIVIHD
jgi:lipoprotein-anchoring transpeptidase ErfK/SrfK